MKYKQEIFAKVEIEGIHKWEGCDIDEVSYLKYPHRHTFVIRSYADVSHGDRDIEFIKLQHSIKQLLLNNFFNDQYKCCVFGNMSCEMIAELLLREFPELTKVEVTEDDENGSILTRM